MTKIGDLSRSLEDYLEITYNLIKEKKIARIKEIAKKKDVKMASVVAALKKLDNLGMVKYEVGEFVEITPEGEKLAWKIHERHKLLSNFLTKVLLVGDEKADGDACAIEHYVSRETVERIVGFMEFIENCPFPGKEVLTQFKRCYPPSGEGEGFTSGCTNEACELVLRQKRGFGRWGRRRRFLSDMVPGQRGKILQLRATSKIRQRLIDMGVLPGVELELIRRAPLGDPIEIKIKGYHLSLRNHEASSIRVSLLTQ